jgi:hypothetical protein
MTRSEGTVVGIFAVVLIAWLVVHGLHNNRKQPAMPAASARTQ